VESAPVAAEPPASGDEPTPTWLFANRMKLAFGIAVAEGILVALENDFSRWTVIVLAIPIVLFYLLAGRSLESRTGREISWILAMSQALAVVAAIIAIFIPAIALILAGVFAAVAAYLLYHDRPDRGSRATTSAD
jgi:predicted membrane protein